MGGCLAGMGGCLTGMGGCLTGMGGCLAGTGGCLIGMGGCLTGIGGYLTGIVTEKKIIQVKSQITGESLIFWKKWFDYTTQNCLNAKRGVVQAFSPK